MDALSPPRRRRTLLVLDDGSWSERTAPVVELADRSEHHDATTVVFVTRGEEGRRLVQRADVRDLDEVNQDAVWRIVAETPFRRVGRVLKNRRTRRVVQALSDVDVAFAGGPEAARICDVIPGRVPVLYLAERVALDLGRWRRRVSAKHTSFLCCDEADGRLLVSCGADPDAVTIDSAVCNPDWLSLASGDVPPSGRSPDAEVIMCVGTLDWWRDPDLFVPLAWQVLQAAQRPLHFVWMAPGAGDRDLWPLDHDLRNVGISAHVTVDVRTTPADVLALSDAVLTFTCRPGTFDALVGHARAVAIPVLDGLATPEVVDELLGHRGKRRTTPTPVRSGGLSDAAAALDRALTAASRRDEGTS